MNYTPEQLQETLATAKSALAEPRPERSAFSGGECGWDDYELAVDRWETRQRKAERVRKLAIKGLAAFAFA